MSKCLVGDVELEDIDIAVIQSGIYEKLTTKISSTGTQNVMYSDVQVSLQYNKRKISFKQVCAKFMKMFLSGKFTHLVPIPRI